MKGAKVNDNLSVADTGVAVVCLIVGGFLGFLAGVKVTAEVYRTDALKAGAAQFDSASGEFVWIQRPVNGDVCK